MSDTVPDIQMIAIADIEILNAPQQPLLGRPADNPESRRSFIAYARGCGDG